MAHVNMGAIVDHLDREFRNALADAVKVAAPGSTVDAHKLLREFKVEVRRKFSTWETVPDSAVQP